MEPKGKCYWSWLMNVVELDEMFNEVNGWMVWNLKENVIKVDGWMLWNLLWHMMNVVKHDEMFLKWMNEFCDFT